MMKTVLQKWTKNRRGLQALDRDHIAGIVTITKNAHIIHIDRYGQYFHIL